MGDMKQFKVDNWGIFFLQRLHLFFSKTDYCDLTLQFEGNVQLKVHRLVVNACTDYFEMLENSDRLIEENTILMPEVLQADVIVPIVNFMYTGMLEFPLYIYDKLYHAAELMKINILMKLLDAQRQQFKGRKKAIPQPVRKGFKANELPATLPGRKLPVWKRRVPQGAVQKGMKAVGAETAKPTRFEWPDDDMPPLTADVMDVSDFGEISYTSTPLLREDDIKIKSEPGLSREEAEYYTNNVNRKVASPAPGEKRKQEITDDPIKRIKITETEKEATISIIESGTKIDPTKLVSDILKRYPNLVKKNKSIKLKILTKAKDEATKKPEPAKAELRPRIPEAPKSENRWYCSDCQDPLTGKPTEFILYYLYRKHMTDVHDVNFDPRTCIYCGILVKRKEFLPFHLFAKHGVKPSNNVKFYQCNLCPCIALNPTRLAAHKKKHRPDEIQCNVCKLAFVSPSAISEHFQITGHQGKGKRSVFDCQFCMNVSSNSLALLIHIKDEHEAEGWREGIVSLDEELDNVEDCEEEEYIEPDKVNILSDVKVATEEKNSLATSLGLLDIVVLDENQQYILQNQNDQQTEYILPETQQVGQVISQRNNEISSTDELVMVLTENDYHEEEQAEIAGDNSNIVVLYSHPVDGQQGQYITSEGDLMVDSRTGLLEIRNGAITTTASNIVVSTPTDSPIETIEMIQREIDFHREKNEGDYEIEPKAKIDEPVYETTEKELESSVEPDQNDSGNTDQVDSAQIEQSTEEPMEVEESNEPVEELNESTEDLNESAEDLNESVEVSLADKDQTVSDNSQTSLGEDLKEGEDIPPATNNVSVEEPDSIDEAKNDEVVEQMEVDGKIAKVNEENDDTITNETIPCRNEEDDKSYEEESKAEESKESVPACTDELIETKSNEVVSQNETTKTAILDDWEDTDSQNSEKKINDRQVNVNKLMDDWEEEEDEDKKAKLV